MSGFLYHVLSKICRRRILLACIETDFYEPFFICFLVNIKKMHYLCIR